MLFTVYNPNIRVTYDPTNTLKFKLFMDINLLVITNVKTGDKSIFDPKTNKVVGTLYDSKYSKGDKHFESWIYELLNITDIPATRKRFIQSIYILDEYCYKKTKPEIYDLVIQAIDMINQEVVATNNGELDPLRMFEYGMRMNKYANDFKQITGGYSSDEFDRMDEV